MLGTQVMQVWLGSHFDTWEVS